MSSHFTVDYEWDAYYWHWMALTSKRLWLTGWNWRVYLSSDELFRRTLVLGPLVIALWRTKETREEARLCEHAMDRIEKGQP